MEFFLPRLLLQPFHRIVDEDGSPQAALGIFDLLELVDGDLQHFPPLFFGPVFGRDHSRPTPAEAGTVASPEHVVVIVRTETLVLIGQMVVVRREVVVVKRVLVVVGFHAGGGNQRRSAFRLVTSASWNGKYW